ncbi:cadherin domain-containing protein [Hyphococcus sp.]|uniref:cadherin domain-containing protein n=1 Tax=Hyphococcus sp. TaxID=2038636 RepID=UPI003CCBE993
MAKSQSKQSADKNLSNPALDEAEKSTTEDLALEAEREALKNARNGETPHPMEGDGTGAHGNLHFGDQQQAEWKSNGADNDGDNANLQSQTVSGDGQPDHQQGRPGTGKVGAELNEPLTARQGNADTRGAEYDGRAEYGIDFQTGAGDQNFAAGYGAGAAPSISAKASLTPEEYQPASPPSETSTNESDRAPVNESPVEITLTANSVDENDAGASIATLSAIDPDANETATFTIAEDKSGLFEIIGNQLKLKDGAALDYEAKDSYELQIQVEDSAGNLYSQTVTIDVADLNEGPSDIQLSNANIDENSAGAVIGTLSAYDPDAGDAVTITVSDERLEVVGGELKVKDGVSFDHEILETLDVTVTATDRGGLSETQSFSIDINDINEGPSDIQLSSTIIDENSAGAVVGTLSAYDPDAGDAVTFSVSDERFEVVGGELKVKDGVSFDHEMLETLDVTVTATDRGGLSETQSFSIDISDVNEGPSDIQLSNANIDENSAGAVVGTLSAYDPDADDAVTFTVSDERFEVVGGELKVKDGVSFDHEMLETLDVTVTATDRGGLSETQSFSIDINDVNEAPDDIALSHSSIDENEAGVLVATLSASDVDASDTVSFSIADDPSGLFEVVGDQLKLKNGAALDHEGQDSYKITLNVSDSGGATYSETVTLYVADINEEPSNLQLSNTSVDENASGETVGVLSAFDPDEGDTLNFTVSDDRFEVVGNELKLKDGVELDFNEADTVNVTVTATDSSGVATSQAFEISVNDVNEGPSLGLASGSGLQASYYNIGHSLSNLDQVDFDAAPDAQGVVESLDYMQGQEAFWDGAPGDYFAAKYEGQLVVENSGTYTFNMASDDGSMLFIDGEPVLDNDGLHGTRTRSVSVDLDEGAHDIEVRYFENGGSQTLQLAWSGPDTGGDMHVIGGEAFQHGDTPDSLSVPEDHAGAVVAALTVTDPDAGDTHSFSVSDDRFEVAEDDGAYVLKLKEGVSLDHEAESAVDVAVTVTDAAGSDDTVHFSIAVEDTNNAPEIDVVGGEGLQASYYNIGHSLSNLDQVDFDAAPDAQGVVESLDYMQGQEAFWDGAPGDYFAAKYEGQLVVENSGTYTFNMASDDGSMLFIDGEPVLDNDGLHGTRTRSVSVDLDEGAHDIEVRYFENGGSQTLQLAWSGPDTGGDMHVIGGDSYRMPGYTEQDQLGLSENTVGDVAAVLSITDADGDTVTYEVSDDRFELVETEIGVALKLKDGAAVDHETESEINVTVTATDEHGESSSTELSIPVADVNEAPTDIVLTPEQSQESIAATIENANVTTGEGGGAGAASIDLSGVNADSAEITIDFTRIDNSLELVVNGQSLTEGVIQLEHAHYDPETESFLQFEDGAAIHQPWVPNDDGSPRIQIVITENGVEAFATRTPGSGVMEPLELVNGEWDLPDFIDGENTVEVINPDSGGPDGLHAVISASYSDDAYIANENADGAIVATLSATDPDAGDTATFAIADDASGLFEVAGNQLKVKDGSALDHEAQSSYDVTLEVTDSGGNIYTETVTINVADVNEAPVDFVFEPVSGGALSLNQNGGQDDVAIAANMEGFPTDALTVEISFTSSQTDVGSGVPLFSYAADGGSNNEALLWLEGSSGEVHVFLAGQKINTGIPNASLLDGEQHQVSFTWDQASNELKVYVDGEEEFASSVNVRDLKADGTVAFGQEQDSEGGGYDANQVFEGEISEARIFDYARSGEEIADNAGKPLSGPEAQTGLVSNWIMNSADGGVIADIAGGNDLQLQNGASIKDGAGAGTTGVLENQDGAVVGTLSATDPDTGEAVTDFMIAEDVSGLFEVVGNELKVKDGVSLDYEAQESYEVTVQATDADGASVQQTITIDVANVNEAPINVSFQPEIANGVLALNTDGGNNDAAIASNMDGFPTDALTVEISFASSQTEVGNGTPLFSYAASDGSDNEALVWLEGSSGNVHIYLAGQKINTGIPNASLLDGEQHQVSFSWDQSTNELKVYVDGDQEFAASVNIRDLKSDGAMVLGQEQDSEGGGFNTGQIFEGEIVEVRIFDYARSDEEIADNAGKVLKDPETEPGLVNNWVMSQENGGVIEDLVGVNHLQLQGDAAIVDSFHGATPTVAENEAGADVGSISATDPNTGAAVTDFTLADDPSGFFEVVGNELKVKDGVSLDYEAQQSYDVTVEAIGAGGETTQYTLTVNVADIDELNVIEGTASADRIIGTNQDDSMNAGAGNDVMRGYDGNDVMYAGDGNDNIDGNAGADELYGGAGDDVIYADADDTVIDGGGGSDRVIVRGDGGVSIDMAASSVERVDGGAGDDHLDASGMTDRANQIGGAGDDTLTGGSGNDVQRGGDGEDIINGGGGNDNIDGNAGADELYGGAGDDVIYADADDTVIDGGDGSDRVIVRGDGGVSIDMAASSVERVDGGAGDDHLDASGMTDRATQIGGGGDDTLTGGSGNDVQRGGDGEDIINGGGGNDNIDGNAGADELYGGAGDDVIYADADDTVIDGGDGSDRVIVRGDGGVSIDMAASSVERVDGGAGDDHLDASGMTDRATQIGGGGDDTLTGGSGNDVQRGGDGEDIITGGDGNDNIRGDAGDDTISGGAGDDYMVGGDGSDVFVYEMGDGSDRVYGGAGGGWTDSIQLSEGDSPLGEFGVDWTIELTEGSIISSDEDGLTFSDDADGVITFNDGLTLSFNDIEEVVI